MQQIIKKFSIFILVFVMVFFDNHHTVNAAYDPPHVLIINSYHQGYNWSDKEMNGIRNSLPEDAVVFVEYMDTKRIESPEYLDHLTDLYHMKFSEEDFDLIFTLDDRAYQFILAQHDLLFPDVPVVFAGVNNFEPNEIENITWITGTVETFDYAKLITLIKDLQPDCETVYVLTDSSLTGLNYRTQLRDLEQKTPLAIPLDYVGDFEEGLKWDEMLYEISQLPENSAILHMSYLRDIEGKVIESIVATDVIAQTANVPVFVDHTQLHRDGIVGGLMKDPYMEGITAGNMGLQILSGTSPDQIPIKLEANTIYQFDHNALTKWNISSRYLPDNSIILNVPSTNMTIDRQFLVWISVLIFFQTSIILLLFWMNRRRKIAEAALLNEQSLLEQKVEERTQDLQEAILVKDHFLANMSHELRTPLTAILGFSELLLLQTDESQSKLQKSLKHIQQSGEHLLSLINDILTVAKINANQIELMPTQIRITHLMHDTVMMIDGKAKQKGIVVQRETDPYLSTLWLDERRIRQVFIILLDNAIKFSPEKSTIKFSAKLQIADTNKVVISVQDQGLGIAEEDQDRIFEPFVQADNELTRAYEGSGLGLTLAKQLVELHGGTIEVHSELGEGTTMNIILPIEVINQDSMRLITQRAKTREELSSLKYQSLSILLIEDNPVTIDLLTSFFDDQKVTLQIATDGKIALERLRHKRQDIILLDLHLPKQDGFEVIRKVRSRGKNKKTPIIVISALVFEEEIAKCLKLGANTFLKKPFSLNDLMNEIHSLVD